MILVSVGANLAAPDGTAPVDSCIAAVAAVSAIAGLRFTAVSPWYRTTAIPKSDQPDYCNGIIRLEGGIGPVELLAALQEIEARFGRVRQALNGPRTLDLDIIDLNGMIRATPAPVLPHPRAHLRAFVLRPILDVAPAGGIRHSGLGCPACWRSWYRKGSSLGLSLERLAKPGGRGYLTRFVPHCTWSSDGPRHR